MKKFQFKKEILKEFEYVLNIILTKKKLPEKYADHSLTGNYKGYRECHVKPDILLIYRIVEAEKAVYLARFGSHSDLFN